MRVMAADTIAYLDAEVGGPAHLVGWSDGAVVALLVALKRPDLVGRLVLIGQYYNSSGRVPGSDLDRFLHTGEAKDFLRQGYDPHRTVPSISTSSNAKMMALTSSPA